MCQPLRVWVRAGAEAEVAIGLLQMNRNWVVNPCLDSTLRQEAAQRIAFRRLDHEQVIDVGRGVRTLLQAKIADAV